MARLRALIWISHSGKCSEIHLLPQARLNCSLRQLCLRLLPELRAEGGIRENRDGKERNGLGTAGNRSQFALRTSPSVSLVRSKWCLGLLQALCIREDFIRAAAPCSTSHDGGSNPERGSSGQDLEETLPKALSHSQKADIGSEPSNQCTTAGWELLQGKKTQLLRSQASFPKKSGVFQGIVPPAPAGLCGIPAHPSISAKLHSLSISPSSETPRRTFGAVYRMMMTMCFS